MRPIDRLSLITFNKNVTIEFNWIKMTSQNCQKISNYVSELNAWGGTNIYAALKEATNMMHIRKD